VCRFGGFVVLFYLKVFLGERIKCAIFVVGFSTSSVGGVCQAAFPSVSQCYV
jgi:hypothetical protein